MPSAYLINTNRQHEPVDFDQLFTTHSVVATYGGREYGQQLQAVSGDDRVFLYDQPSGEYIAIGRVTDPWSGNVVTDPDAKAAPESSHNEYHAGIVWEWWTTPGDGYSRATVNRALGYKQSYAPQRAVVEIDRPSTSTIDRVYSAISDGIVPGPALTDAQEAVLRQWAAVVETVPSGAEFDLEGHNRTDDITRRADEFIADPSEDRFKSMWGRMHSAIQGGRATLILDKWEGTIEELAAIVEDIRDADRYDATWESTLGGKMTVRELFGSLHIDEYPILNAASVNGLTFFGYDEPGSYEEGARYFAEFLETYKRLVGHATRDASHGIEVPLRFEVDQLFNVIDKVDERSLSEESSEPARELYRSILEMKEETYSTSYYWVSHKNDETELENEYLSAPADDNWRHDLPKLNVGDVVYHYFEKAVVGRSTVTTEATTHEQDGEDHYRVEVELTRFETPRPLDEVGTYLNDDDVRGGDYYPINESGGLQAGYLHELTEAAAERLDNPPVESKYFWITANPSIWSVDSIDHGGEVFYTAYNQSGNKRRIFGAFEAATPGDRVLFYESTPVKAIVAEGTITEGLHEEPDEDGESIAGVTIRYDRAVEPISWDQLTAVDELADASPITNRAQGSLFQLTAGEFETILALEELTPEAAPRYFWVNADTATWEGPGDQVTYSTTGSGGNDRRNQEAFQRARPGDYVLVYRISPAKQIVGKAHIAAGLDASETDGGVQIEWDESIEGVKKHHVENDPELGDGLATAVNRNVLTELTEQQYERILELGDADRYGDYTDDLTISDDEITATKGELHFGDEEWNRIQRRVERALADGNHVLLFGPPGTGKTKLARNVCEETVDDEYELVTASADWSTFDTVGGYQTTAANTLEFQSGVVLDRFHADDEGAPANEWLIIDELNRADIDKAFGSLFSALTGESVTLPFDGTDGDPIEILDSKATDTLVTPERFYIPDDWRMLATMNTLDKTSLYEMSYAFMRRWAFVPVGIPDLHDPETKPDALAEFVGAYLEGWADEDEPSTDEYREPIGRIWHAVNEQRAIGPAIIEDIYEYVAGQQADDSSDDGPDYASPIIMYVFPQLEGLRKTDIESVLTDLSAIVDDDDEDELWRTARDFFQVDVQRDQESK